MDKIFTREKQNTYDMSNTRQNGPRQQTLSFLKQFARIYVPVVRMPGLVSN